MPACHALDGQLLTELRWGHGLLCHLPGIVLEKAYLLSHCTKSGFTVVPISGKILSCQDTPIYELTPCTMYYY
jgi:hypothetical protein